MFRAAIGPSAWGAEIDYDSVKWTPWRPDKWVIHWNGPALPTANNGVEAEKAILRGFERYHVKTKGWLGVAYNYAIGQSGTLYRLRGENRSGATSGDAEPDGIPENHEARAVCFLIGQGQKPSDAALATFAEMWAEDPMPVLGHQQASSTGTTCPGPDLMNFIRERGYENMAQFSDEIAEILVDLAYAVKSRNSHGSALGFLIEDARKDIVTRDELNAALKSVSGGLSLSQILSELRERLR